jgi:hypothetical protein
VEAKAASLLPTWDYAPGANLNGTRRAHVHTGTILRSLRNWRRLALLAAGTYLGEANININYAYAGVEPRTNAPLRFEEVGRAAKLLDQVAAAAAGA